MGQQAAPPTSAPGPGPAKSHKRRRQKERTALFFRREASVGVAPGKSPRLAFPREPPTTDSGKAIRGRSSSEAANRYVAEGSRFLYAHDSSATSGIRRRERGFVRVAQSRGQETASHADVRQSRKHPLFLSMLAYTSSVSKRGTERAPGTGLRLLC